MCLMWATNKYFRDFILFSQLFEKGGIYMKNFVSRKLNPPSSALNPSFCFSTKYPNFFLCPHFSSVRRAFKSLFHEDHLLSYSSYNQRLRMKIFYAHSIIPRRMSRLEEKGIRMRKNCLFTLK